MMMKDQKNEKSGVVDVSHMYVGPQQRASLLEKAFDSFRKKGYSFNQAKALAAQTVDSFMDEQRRKRVEEIRQANDNDADQMAQDFIDQELGPKL